MGGKVEEKGCLAEKPVCSEMKFWNYIGDEESPENRSKEDRVHQKSLYDIMRPLTSDVIRDKHAIWRILLEGRQEEIVHVDISTIVTHQKKLLYDQEKNTYHSPFCRSPTAMGHFMSCRMQSTAPTPLAAVPLPPRILADFNVSWLLQVLTSSGILPL
jgi:hypothetical protein